MNVIVCGAGQVGSNIARALATEGNDVTVIDTSAELVQKLSDTFDVRGIVGHASLPNVLEQAGASDADMIIAVTHADEVNMVACQVAHVLFSVPTKIARVRQQNYLNPMWANLFSSEHLAIDVIISPEVEVAKAVSRRLDVPAALDVVAMADSRISVIGVRCDANCPIIDTPLRHLTDLFPDLAIVIIAISRAGKNFVPGGDDQIVADDEVYFLADTQHVQRAMSAFGHEEPEARRTVIIGGGNIGLYLCQTIQKQHPDMALKVIEQSKPRAEYLAQALPRVAVLHGDALDPDILNEARIGTAEAVIAVTNDDEVNILASLLAKRHGCQRALTLVNKGTYPALISQIGIDTVISPRGITTSTILQHIRRGRIRAVHTVGDGVGEVIEAEALETSGLVGMPLREARLPPGTIVGAVIHNDHIVIARPDTVIRPHDRVVLFALADAVKRVEKLFAVRLEFF
jgi:trk system potassium uptake protein